MGSQGIIWARGLIVQSFRITNHITYMIFSIAVLWYQIFEDGWDLPPFPLRPFLPQLLPKPWFLCSISLRGCMDDFKNVILNTLKVWRILKCKSCVYILKGKDLRLIKDSQGGLVEIANHGLNIFIYVILVIVLWHSRVQYQLQPRLVL